MSQPVKINHEFICKNCGKSNPPAHKTCRNHCFHCLYSMHVDAEVPGDRASDCHALMEPIGIDQKSKKGFIILHKCLKCGKTIPNKVADDDEIDAIIRFAVQARVLDVPLMSRPNQSGHNAGSKKNLDG